MVQEFTTQFYRPLYFLQSQPRVQAIPYYYQPTFLYQQPAPPPRPQAFFQPGQVPAWVPRETRYELINGVLTPVEHFCGRDIGLPDPRGYNPLHGYDNGPPPLIGAVAAQARGYNTLHGFDNGPPPPAQAPNRSLVQRVFGGTQGSSGGNSIGSAVTLVGEPEEGSHTAQEPAQNAEAEPSASSGAEDSGGDTAASDASSTAATTGGTEPAASSANGEEGDRGALASAS